MKVRPYASINVSILVMLLAISIVENAWAQTGSTLQRTLPKAILVVSAHPDDELSFGATIYASTHTAGVPVDLAVLTDGSGGYGHAQLAASLYGIKGLSSDAVARTELPSIRKKECMASGNIMGIRHYYFFDYRDDSYTLEPEPAFATWDVAVIKRRLGALIVERGYDLVFVILPSADQHGHHKAATILLLETVLGISPAQRPYILAAPELNSANAQPVPYTQMPNYGVTRVQDTHTYQFDRTAKMLGSKLIDYRVLLRLLIAEHKSQGSLLLITEPQPVEYFTSFAISNRNKEELVNSLFSVITMPTTPGKASP